MNKYLLIAVVMITLGFTVPTILLASETDGTVTTGGNNGYAWSNQVGWINFGTVNGDIHITDSGITGYAWSTNYGWINMSPTNGGVSAAANGSLSGYAWGENLGWINFSGVSISSAGTFSGTASGSIVGTLSFDCTNCSVQTDYVPQNYRSGTATTTSGDSSGNGMRLKKATSTETSSEIIPTGIDTTTFPPAISPTQGAGAVERETTGGATVDTAVEGEIPEQLIDVRFLLDNTQIERLLNLVTRVTLTNFGRRPTQVDLTFTIVDSAGNEVWQGSDFVTVETDLVFTKRFADIGDLPQLADGDYVLRLHTLYNTVVEDDFEIPFTIGASPYEDLVKWMFVATFVLLVLAITWRIMLVARRNKGLVDTKNFKNRFNL